MHFTRDIYFKALFIVGTLLAIIIAILPVSVPFPFIADDYTLLRSALENPFPIFSGWIKNDFLYRPLAILSFNLNYHISGYNPWSFYVLNFLIHAATSVLFFVLLKKIFFQLQIDSSQRFAILLSMMFFFSPSAIMDVYWISGRTDLLCTFFIIGSLIAFTDNTYQPSFKHGLLMVILTVLAFLCKETAVLLSVYALVILKAKDHHSWKNNARRTFYSYGILTGGYFIFRYVLFGNRMAGMLTTEHSSLGRILSGILYGLWSLFLPIDILDIYALVIGHLYVAIAIVVVLVFAVLVLLFGLRYVASPIQKFSLFAIGGSILSLLIYINSFPSSRLMYPLMPLFLLSGGGVLVAVTHYRHWLRTASLSLLIGATFVASFLVAYRSVVIARFEKNLQQAILQCNPITNNDTVVLLGGLCRIGQTIACFNHGLDEKISYQNTGEYYPSVCKSYGSIALDCTDPLNEVSYLIQNDSIVVVTYGENSSLVPNVIDRYSTVTYNNDSSIVCYPRKYMRLRRNAPRECAVLFNDKIILPSAKIIFLYRGSYYVRTLLQFKNELSHGSWQ